MKSKYLQQVVKTMYISQLKSLKYIKCTIFTYRGWRTRAVYLDFSSIFFLTFGASQDSALFSGKSTTAQLLSVSWRELHSGLDHVRQVVEEADGLGNLDVGQTS